MSLKPICVPCERFMRCKKTGFYFLEGMPSSNEEWDGKRGKDSIGWAPYKIWGGDIWECPDCGARIISGVAQRPIAEQHQEKFGEALVRTNAGQLLIKDC